jgi:hypothetical protein
MNRVATSGRAAAEGALSLRRANKPEQVDNASLYAGSPMYFYCISCGAQCDCLPENYLGTPKKLCCDCQDMKDMGWLE